MTFEERAERSGLRQDILKMCPPLTSKFTDRFEITTDELRILYAWLRRKEESK